MKRMVTFFSVLLLATLLIQCGGPKKLTPEEYNKLSPQERVASLEKYVEKNPNDIESKKMLYKEYLQLGMTDQALPLMKSIVAIDPFQPDVQFDYGVALMQRGETQSAYRAFRDALQSPGGLSYQNKIAKYVGGRYTVQQITNSPANEAFAEFSPDGSKIVFQTDVNGNWDIAEKELASDEIRMLIESPADEELPCYSPDGTALVYTTNKDDRRPIDNKFKVREIYRRDLTSGFESNLTQTVADDWLPRFSHSGDRILFVTERTDLRSVPYTEKHSDIFSMESDGDFHLQLTSNPVNEGGACFSADDSHIYFHSNRNGSYDIFVIKSDGSTPMTVIGNPEANEVSPYASPDSLYIYYFSDESGQFDIYRARTDGSAIERLTYGPAANTNPAVSPDGKSVVFHSNQNGNYDIFLLNLEAAGEPSSEDLISRLNQLIGE